MTEDGVHDRAVRAHLDEVSRLRELTEAVRQLPRADTVLLCRTLMKAYEGDAADTNRLSGRVRNWVAHRPSNSWDAWVNGAQRRRQEADPALSDLWALRTDQNEIQSDFLIA